eukprot:scaffold49096_cov47-Phaeocystis_antarctica.AAC.2
MDQTLVRRLGRSCWRRAHSPARVRAREEVVPQDVVSDTQGRPTAEAGYSSDYAEVELSSREQFREKAALCFGAHRGALIVGDRLSCHAVREVGVGEHVRNI